MEDELVWDRCCADRRKMDGSFSWCKSEFDDCERARKMGYDAIHRFNHHYSVLDSFGALVHAPLGF